MTNTILETVAEIANAERKRALREGDYGWALVAAAVENWAIQEYRRGGYT
jgi:hypothetical protein